MTLQHVNGVPLFIEDPTILYNGLDQEPTWFSAQGGVYRCHERHHPFSQVAIKKYLVESTPKYPDLFVMPKELVENEIYTMTTSIHPNILTLNSVYLYKEFVYLVMPYCTGGSLQQYVFEHHLTVGQVVNIIQSIASGLAEIHCHGYIHRDIKCDNIFLHKETNSIVIGDFGVVSVNSEADSSLEEAGVVLFWSPELVQRKIVDCKIDIWALGIVILEILNGGRAPYEDEKLEEEEIKRLILQNGRPDYPAGLPPLLVDLMDKCLEPDPTQRASACDILNVTTVSETLGDGEMAGDAHVSVHSLSSWHSYRGHQTTNSSIEEKPEQVVPLNDHVSEADSQTSPAMGTFYSITGDSPQEVPTYCNSSVDTPSMPSLQPHEISTASCSSKLGHDSATTTRTSSTDSTLDNTKTAAPHSVLKSRRCRIPQRAFILEEKENASARETIESVLRKRQSMSEACRSQGSRLPLLVISEKKLRHTRSVCLGEKLPLQRTSSSSAVDHQRKLIRIRPLPNLETQHLSVIQRLTPDEVPVPSKATVRVSPAQTITKPANTRIPAINGMSQVIPPSRTFVPRKDGNAVRTKAILNVGREYQDAPRKRQSVFRYKCSPAENRTTRLAIGISTTGRQRDRLLTRESADGQPVSMLPKLVQATDAKQKRPVSLAVNRNLVSVPEKRFSQPLHPKYARTTSPLQSSLKERRLSVKPLAVSSPDPKATSPKLPISSQPKRRTGDISPKQGAFKDAKPVRVH